MKNILLLIGFIFEFANVQSQSLKIGDQVPDINLEYVKMDKVVQTSLSAFKGKIVILDFWSIYCASCIKEFPKLDTLQKDFKESLQVILVTKNTKSQLNKFWQTGVKSKKVDLPMVEDDTVLSRLFPYTMVPHQVWIDTNGKVLTITSSWNTTAANLKKVLGGDRSFFTVKNDVIDFDYEQPLWLEGNGRFASKLQFYSYLTGRIDGIPGGIGVSSITDSVSKKKKITGLHARNTSILQLMEKAYGGYWGINPFRYRNRIMLYVKNPEKVLAPDEKTAEKIWYRENSYCYELKVPPSQADDFFEIMQDDLSRYFGLEGKIETRKISCLLLVRTIEKDLLRTSGEPSVQKQSEEGNSLIIKNRPINVLVQTLAASNAKSPLPFVDATGYKENIDMTIQAKLNDIAAVRKELNRYGLDLIRSETELEMLIIRDKNSQRQGD